MAGENQPIRSGAGGQFYYEQLDALPTVRQQVRRELLADSQKHQAWKRLCGIPSIGPIRAAVPQLKTGKDRLLADAGMRQSAFP